MDITAKEARKRVENRKPKLEDVIRHLNRQIVVRADEGGFSFSEEIEDKNHLPMLKKHFVALGYEVTTHSGIFGHAIRITW